MSLIIAQNIKYTGQTLAVPSVSLAQHFGVVGKTGTGKSNLLYSVAGQLFRSKSSMCFIDPHGDAAFRLQKIVWPHAIKELNITDVPSLFTFNPVAVCHKTSIPYATSSLLDAFKLYWSDAWGIRMEHILRNCILTLLEVPNSNLSHINLLLTDDEFRASALIYVTNPEVTRFWQTEYEKWPASLRLSAIAPIQNKMGALLSDPTLYQVFCGEGKPLDFRKILDEGQSLIINLSKGTIGGDNAGLLGTMIVSAIGSAAYSRADTPERERKPYYVIVDEFQNFTTLAFANMLSELRKYKVGMVLATQFLGQLKPDIKEAVFGNIGTLISFRVGPTDAPYLAREFKPKFYERHLLNLPDHQIIMKTLVDGRPCHPFRAKTIHPKVIEQMVKNPFL